jgi:hypothetical protein
MGKMQLTWSRTLNFSLIPGYKNESYVNIRTHKTSNLHQQGSPCGRDILGASTPKTTSPMQGETTGHKTYQSPPDVTEAASSISQQCLFTVKPTPTDAVRMVPHSYCRTRPVLSRHHCTPHLCARATTPTGSKHEWEPP